MIKAPPFILNTSEPAVQAWLESALRELGELAACRDSVACIEQVSIVNPRVVFLAFSGTLAQSSVHLAERLTALYPDLPLIAVGTTQDAAVVVQAMRCGARDFIDIAGSPAEALQVVKRVALEAEKTEPGRSGRVVALIGARVGVGTTSLAANLAVHIRRHLRRQGDDELLLLDLGLPVRDASLYMKLAPNFSFADAVRNVRRFDKVFAQTAMGRHGSGVSVLPLPVTLADMKDVSFVDALGLVNRLRSFFALQIIDLGGFNNIDFTSHLLKAADEVILVADQSVGAIVSAAELLQELKKREVETNGIHLVVSKFDARLGIDAATIAERLELRSVLTVPDRREALMLAANQGAVLAQQSPSDPLIRALQPLCASLGYRFSHTTEGLRAKLSRHMPWLVRQSLPGN
jgi:pilus assembly protein CpaE